jgi:hypothetical protein
MRSGQWLRCTTCHLMKRWCIKSSGYGSRDWQSLSWPSPTTIAGTQAAVGGSPRPAILCRFSRVMEGILRDGASPRQCPSLVRHQIPFDPSVSRNFSRCRRKHLDQVIGILAPGNAAMESAAGGRCCGVGSECKVEGCGLPESRGCDCATVRATTRLWAFGAFPALRAIAQLLSI